MEETEIKVLEINKKELIAKLKSLGATLKKKEQLLRVWWYCHPQDVHGPWPWYLRIRDFDSQDTQATWKSKGAEGKYSHTAREINIDFQSTEQGRMFLEAIDLVLYAYQEKKRSSWTLDEWTLEIDEYPEIPTFMEIEGESDSHVHEAIILLGLDHHEKWNGGERKLITEKYHRDWFKMQFSRS